MKKTYKLIVPIVLFLGVLGLLMWFLRTHTVAVLSPRGFIAAKERHLMIAAVLLSCIVVIPVFIMTFAITWKYRASNKKAAYMPDWDRSKLAESVWWGVPLVLIIILSGMTWVSTRELDPYKSLASTKKPITIQAIALEWKWLFIYPEQHIAAVNYVQFPEGTPVNFEITADAPMNSFWIPQLGGQVYAMAGMKTQLHLMADHAGEFKGSSSNLSGKGFAGMKFTAKASSAADFASWVDTVKRSPTHLSSEVYAKLAEPSENNPVLYYSATEDKLYDTIIMKFMRPATDGHGMSHMDPMGQSNMPSMPGMEGMNMENTHAR